MTAHVGVIGLGYVGLPLLAAFFRAGCQTLGFDTDPKKVAALHAGRNYIAHLGDAFARDLTASDRFDATDDMARLAEPDALLICVPTPLTDALEPDLSAVQSTARDIAHVLRPGQLVVLESTTYPGTTRDVVRPILESSGLRAGTDFHLAYSPEREDPGRADRSVGRIPKLVGGTDAASAAAAAELYRRIVPEVVEVSSCEVAEASKLCENIFRSVNIALVNELKGSLGAMGLDVWEVIDAASTKPFGFMRFEPGPGLGGHCIPIDPYYLAWRAKQAGAESRFIELAGDVNRAMPNTVVGATARALEARGVAPASARVLVLGLAYKPNVDDPRESPSFELIEGLRARGCAVEYHDPHIPVAPKGRRYDLKLESIDLTDEALASYDAVLIATAHDAYDWHSILAASRLLVDTRGVTRRLPDPEGKVVRA